MFARTKVAPREATVECGGQRHTIRCEAGRLVLVDHPGDRDADEVLVVLSGRPARCRAIEEAWHRLGHERALELLGAGEETLQEMARRAPVALDQRERVRRRDDIADDQRSTIIAGFDAVIYLGSIAALGPQLAGARGLVALNAMPRGSRRAVRTARRRFRGSDVTTTP